jgi:type II restriction/modification system DNA methylase subunit YeeA
MNWSQIDPSIFGTLFERGLDPDKRSQLGAHYTDAQSILRLIKPVILEPLLTEWEQIKPSIAEQMMKVETAKSKSVQTKSQKAAANICNGFLKKLRQLRILDPACGSGNFLYLALQGLKDLEHRVLIEAEALGLGKQFPDVTPHILAGIEINPYAAELARVTIWIGYIQWLLTHGFNLNKQPILQKLDNIECRDALLNVDDSEAQWPQADFIVGNPPFLGDKKMISVLGEDYTTQLRQVYKGRVPGGADLVTYWFAKAGDKVKAGETQIVGLVSTNSIRGGANRKVLDRLTDYAQIFNAWSDEPWVLEGAAVRVSLVGFAGKDKPLPVVLNGVSVKEIYTDLTALAMTSEEVNLTKARRLKENAKVSFMGTTKNGAFDIPGDLARQWLKMPANPGGEKNQEVLFPWVNGLDITRRQRDFWIIDFGVNMSEEQAVMYEQPFFYIEQHVKPKRVNHRKESNEKYWWRYEATRPEMRKALKPLRRFIVTPTIAKFRLFAWLEQSVQPDHQLIAIARDDDTTFGILHSRFHELWSLRLCTWLGKGNDPRYTPTTTFETFPFPQSLTPNIPAKDYADNPHAQAIAAAAKKLDQLRNNWLNPPELVKNVPEVVAGYPDRLLPVNEEAAKELKNRTLTKLYNTRPQWLVHAHQALDKAVAQAYGWEVELSDEEILAQLLKLNLER